MTWGSSKEAIDSHMATVNPVIILPVMLVFLAIFGYTGIKIYDKHIGHRLRTRGWNETSYLRGLQITFLTLLVLHVLPILTLALGYKIFTLIKF